MKSRTVITLLWVGITVLLAMLISRILNARKMKSLANTDANVKAFLAVIRKCEGTAGPNGYRMLFGGGLFDSFADHPRQVVHASGYDSSAAGAYQFLSTTWDEERAALMLPDFSPQSQDAAAVNRIRKRGGLEHLQSGRLDEAVQAICPEWASLPVVWSFNDKAGKHHAAGKSYYGQPCRTLTEITDWYQQAGGQLA